MNRHQQFVTVVQTGVMVLANHGDIWGERGPLAIVAAACRLPEEVVPEDVERAALEFLEHMAGMRAEPEWLAAWREACGSDSPASC